ncbi:hypothetical protein AMTRI_Chr07g28870 [Amborella trichopoda]
MSLSHFLSPLPSFSLFFSLSLSSLSRICMAVNIAMYVSLFLSSLLSFSLFLFSLSPLSQHARQ